MTARRRPSARARGYNAEWEKARLEHLSRFPYCAHCARQGLRTKAVAVDHIRPHRGDRRLFWDRTNWQSLCHQHHDRFKQQAEVWGYSGELGQDGLPLDPNHPFNRTERKGGEKSPDWGRGPVRGPRTELVSANGSQEDSSGPPLRERRGFQKPQASIGSSEEEAVRPSDSHRPVIDATPSAFRVVMPWE